VTDTDRLRGGDEVMLLEVIDVAAERPHYVRVSWLDLNSEEFSALEDNGTIALMGSNYVLSTPDEVGRVTTLCLR
jgi:hypothetical protein